MTLNTPAKFRKYPYTVRLPQLHYFTSLLHFPTHLVLDLYHSCFKILLTSFTIFPNQFQPLKPLQSFQKNSQTYAQIRPSLLIWHNLSSFLLCTNCLLKLVALTFNKNFRTWGIIQTPQLLSTCTFFSQNAHIFTHLHTQHFPHFSSKLYLTNSIFPLTHVVKYSLAKLMKFNIRNIKNVKSASATDLSIWFPYQHFTHLHLHNSFSISSLVHLHHS